MLLLVHSALMTFGRFLGALVIMAAVFALHAVPVGALILAGVYASEQAIECTGGGTLVGMPVLFAVWGLGAVYVAPHVAPKLAAMVGAVTWD